MEAKVWSFLQGISVEELVDRNVLQRHRTLTYLLRRDNVGPLIRLMEDRGMSKLYHEDIWFLCNDGTFMNTTSRSLKSGNVFDLKQPGNLFMGKNNVINPFFHRTNPSK